MPGVHSVTLGVWLLSGSRHEPFSQQGISHFVEHMLFKGTETRSARAIALEIGSVGGVLNAFTSREYCCFYAKILSEKLPLAIDLLADILLNPVLNLDEMEKERRVILQEILMLEDDAEGSVQDLFCQGFWPGHPLSSPITGTLDSVDRLSRQELLQFINGHVRGDNLLISAAGCLDHGDVVRQITTTFGALPELSVAKIVVPPQATSGMDVKAMALERIHLCLGTSALGQRHPQRFVAFLLNTILGGSMCCRLFQKVREDHGLAYSIYSCLNSHSDGGGLLVYAATSHEHASRVISLILREMWQLTRELVTDQELLSAKEQLTGSLLLSLESSETRMMRLAKNEIYLGHQPDVAQIVQAFACISRDDILRLAAELFQDHALRLQLLGPIERVDFPLLDLTFG